MFYRVKGVFRAETAAELHRKISDGTISDQKPDGAEVVAALGRAIIATDGRVQWNELCYCDPPLKHERATVLDRFFDQIETEIVAGREVYEGPSFMEHLERLVAK